MGDRIETAVQVGGEGRDSCVGSKHTGTQINDVKDKN